MKTVKILNCPITFFNMDETLNYINTNIKIKNKIHHTAVNAMLLVNMKSDKELFDAIINSDIINADGQSVILASKFLNKPLPERVAGIDLMENLIKLAYNEKYKIFFLGAKEDIIKKVIEKYSIIYSKNIIAGYRNGYFNENEELEIIKLINESNANILFIGMSSPKKEKFLYKYKNKINVNFMMSVGGSFDVIAGAVKRAPLWMQKFCLEWFYRFIQEPKRMWKRYLYTNTMFIYYVIREKLFGN
ncbi:MAG: WecB/TagA/CpsF family glycosyltransferase [Candidatus Wallbacteria bacterium]